MTAPAGREPRTFTIEMPAGMELLNSGDRISRHVRAKRTRELRTAAGWWARALRIPLLERARIVVEYRLPAITRNRDAGSWAPTGEACIDGCRDAGIIRDDHSRIVVEESCTIGEQFPRGRIVIHITEVIDEPGEVTP